MPRVSLKQARLNRATIVENAARLFLKRGLRSIALSEVMATSGLTLGGFYGHFESREAPLSEDILQVARDYLLGSAGALPAFSDEPQQTAGGMAAGPFHRAVRDTPR